MQVRLPLAGIRVIDFGRFIAGPYCAMLLADMGAESIAAMAVKTALLPRSRKPAKAEDFFPSIATNATSRWILLNQSRRRSSSAWSKART
jgi:crotonobetainyl-CoA:carnitine CoA-transferase CaiB-like acyl-CoA transferase